MSNSPYHQIVFDLIKYTPTQGALLLFDRRSSLAQKIANGYRDALPQAKTIDFDATNPEAIFSAIEILRPGDLVILVQSSSFRLNAFRFRVELFKRGLAVVEHPHLERMRPDEEDIYIDSLRYDPSYYQTTGRFLKQHIDVASLITLQGDGIALEYKTSFEDAKLNIGDYTGMKNRGGQFPIGEVFTEPKDFSGVNGSVNIFAFGDTSFHVHIPEKPITLLIEEGLIVGTKNAPEIFEKILEQIHADEPLSVRELGFGMNRAFTKNRRVSDIGSYERMCGIHLSLGQKHAMYNKPGISKRKSKYHVDVFADVTSVVIDNKIVYKEGRYLLP